MVRAAAFPVAASRVGEGRVVAFLAEDSRAGGVEDAVVLAKSGFSTCWVGTQFGQSST